MPTHNDYITQGEFSRWIGDWRLEEANFRSRLEARMGEQHAYVRTELNEIKGMVKEANGKTNRNGEAIAIIQRDLDAIKSEDNAIEQAVEDIRARGCAQLQTHQEVLTGLGWGAKKKAAVAGGLLGTGALIWPAVQQIAEAVHAYLDKAP